MPIKDFDAWKEAVKKAYPKEASRLQFKGRIEHGHDTISAEIRGEDRCYGVWDNDKEEGQVLEASIMKANQFLSRARSYLEPTHKDITASFITRAVSYPDVKSLKKAITQRVAYEKIQDELKRIPPRNPRHKVLVEKLKTWKASNPDYPRRQLRDLKKQLTNMEEKADPSKKENRKQVENGQKQKFQLRKQLESLRETLRELKDPDYDYTPDDVDPQEYVERIKNKIKELQKQLRALK